METVGEKTKLMRQATCMSYWLVDYGLDDPNVDRLMTKVCDTGAYGDDLVLDELDREHLRNAARNFYGDDQDVESLFAPFGIA